MFGFKGFRPKAEPDLGPPPTREEYPDDYELAFAEIIWSHGGLDCFSFVQRKRAEQLAELLCNPPDAADRDRYLKFVDVTERLESRLPPLRVPKVNPTPVFTANMTLQEQANVYGRMVNDPTCFDDVVTVAESPFALPISDQVEPAPARPADAPTPPTPTSPRPAPENAPTVPQPKAATPSEPDFIEPIELSASVVELPPDPRLAAFGRTVYSGVG